MEHQTPFRELALACPRCRASLPAGEPSFCRGCDGAWISEQALVDRVATMQHAPAAIEWSIDDRETIACAACRAPMTALRVFGVPIDRCTPHGFWFDRDELAQVLYESSKRPPAEHRPVVVDDGGWGGVAIADGVINTTAGATEVVVAEGMTEVVGAGAEVAAEVGVEIAAAGVEAGAGVAGAVLEAIGELLGGLLG